MCGVAPERTKCVFVGAHEDYIRSHRALPGRTKGAWDVARKDQGRVGQSSEGPRVRWVAPRRTKGALVGAHEEYMKSQGTVPKRTKGR